MVSETSRKGGSHAGLQSYDFERSVGYWLILAARAYQKAFDVELAPHRLTYRQAQVLGWLVLDGELSQVELADRMMIRTCHPGRCPGSHAAGWIDPSNRRMLATDEEK